MKAFIFGLLAFASASIHAQNHSSKNIRVMVEQEHDHIGGYESASVRVKLFNPQNEILYEADLFNGTELDETFYYYNESDDLEYERTIFHDYSESGKVEFTYNLEGMLVEEAAYDHQHNPLHRITMTYDKAGKMLQMQKEIRRDGETELSVESDFTFTYDPMGRVSKQEGFERGKADLPVAYQFWYENGGLTQIRERLDEEATVVERWTEVYSADDHKMSYFHSVYVDKKEKILTEVSYSYTTHGDVQTETVKKEGKVVDEIIFRYDYDNHGNWITKKEFKGSDEASRKEVVTVQRWIEYYEKDNYGHAPMELDELFTVATDEASQKMHHVSAETHVRINNNNEQVVWQVRRNGSDIFQCDYNQYVGGVLIQTKHMNNYQKPNYYTNYNYDETGKLTSEESFAGDNTANNKVVCAYNAAGQLIKRDEMRKADEGDGWIADITEAHTYSKAGKLFKTTLTEFDEEIEIEYIYDTEGNISVKEQTPAAKGETPFIEKFTYQNGRMISRDVYSGKDKEPSENDEFEYNDSGELLKSSFYEKARLRSVTLYEYFQ